MTALPGAVPQRRRRAAMLAGQLRWRIGHVARRAGERLATGVVLAVAQQPALAHLPRWLVVPFERLLLRTADGQPFDSAGYLERNPDVRRSGRAALDHYLRWGWSEGRNPRPDLDERAYRAGAGFRRGVRVSALAHHLASRRWTPEPPPPPPADMAGAEELLDRLRRLPPRPVAAPAIDVIVPVYRGRVESLNCLLHVLESPNATPANVLVVDDRGPDRALRADLRRLARRGLIELLVQPRNLGFVAAVNAGMARHPDRDVIWLNADTEPHGDWIDRLVRVADTDARIATVTPLTNNGTIASYPVFDRDNPTPLEIGWQAVDRLAARANGLAAVDVPTCVGFCTYVRRAAIRAVGPLDFETFGRGYGEENDFSCRAAAAGWRNVIAGGVFVRHLGAASFGPEKAARIDAAMRAMARRHPDYHAAIARFAAADPVAPMRHALDLARMAHGLGGHSALLIGHSRGGGTERHLQEEMGRLSAVGRGSVVMTGGSRSGTVRLSRPGLAATPSLEAVPFAMATLAQLSRRLGISEIQVHHLIEMPEDAADQLVWLADALDVPLDLCVHDYFAICPRINLADRRGRYCGEPGPAACRRCLRSRRSPVGAPDIEAWRSRHGRLIAAARMVRVPDGDVAARLERYFGQSSAVVVRPHERVVRPAPGRASDRDDGVLRIAVIGAIGPIKGFDVLLGLARHIRRSGAAAEISVIGYTRNDAAASAAGITVTGRYGEAEVAGRIRALAPDLIFIPSTWPETFCYTLSHALASGLPVAAFDLGAQATRLRALGEGGLIPLGLADAPDVLLSRLRQIAAGPADAATPQQAAG